MDGSEIIKKNESDANRSLIRGFVVTAIVMIAILICYATGLFKTGYRTLINVYIVFPIIIAVLVSSLFFYKRNIVSTRGFKYFLISQYLIVIFILNILLPRHTLYGWPLCIIIVAHYYNHKVTLFTFITVLVLMLAAMYLSMFFGEWEPHFMDGLNTVTVKGIEYPTGEMTPDLRFQYLDELIAAGNNRYLKVFLYYFLPRLAISTIITYVCDALNKRSFKLLSVELETARNNQKMQGELETASSIQSSVLPKSFPKDKNEKVYALMEPAKGIGGDFYDYFFIDDTHLALVVADVSGKGTPAALFMMKTETLIQSLATSIEGANTATILQRANASLCLNNEAMMFVTCWLGIVDVTTGEMKYANAGHNYPVIISSEGVYYLNSPRGLILGGMENVSYQECTLKLKQGDKIVLYTDGVTEAHDANEGLYGDDRLLKFAYDNRDSEVHEFVDGLRRDVANFSTGQEQFDDITILMFEYRSEAKTTAQSKVFNADTKELSNLFEYANSLLEILGFTQKEIIRIDTALEEVFVNVANYAYDTKGVVEVGLSSDNDRVTFIFKDSGHQFNPLEKVDPDINASSEERDIGGLGIYMVKNIMDEVTYKYENNQNILTLVKCREK